MKGLIEREKKEYISAIRNLDKYLIFYSKKLERDLDIYFLDRATIFLMYKIILLIMFIFSIICFFLAFISYAKDGNTLFIKSLILYWGTYAIFRYNPIFVKFKYLRLRFFILKESYSIAFANEKIEKGYDV